MIIHVVETCLILLVCTVKFSCVDEQPSFHPVTTAVGSEVRLNYTSDSGNVHWFKYTADPSSSEIYASGRGILEEFRGRFFIANGSKADLIITNVLQSDAAKYKCLNVENEVDIYLLIVVENNLTCTVTVKPDDDWKFCGPFESISVTCEISYYGKALPKIGWKKRRGNHDETITPSDAIAINSSSPFMFSSTVLIRSRDLSEDDFEIVSFVDQMQTISDQFQWKSSTYKAHCTVKDLPTEVQQTEWTSSETLKGTVENLPTEVQQTEWTSSETVLPDRSNIDLLLIIIGSLLGIGLLSSVIYRWCKRRIIGLFRPGAKQDEQGENQSLLPSIRSSKNLEPLIVRGIAALQDEIYIVFQGSSFIRVICNTEKFIKKTDIQLHGIKEPWSLEANNYNQCLYIGDRKLQSIWEITVRSDAPVLIKRVCELQHPYKFSVTSGGRILVPVWPNSLQIRTPDGSSKQSLNIVLPRDMLEPYYVLETSREAFIVAHGHERSKNQRVCKIQLTADRKQCVVQWSFPGNDRDKIANIDQMAIDEDGRIFVTDQNKGRILLLDKNGRKICEVKTEKLPYRLCYAMQKKQLLVGHYAAISVYMTAAVEGQGAHTDELVLQLQHIFQCEGLPQKENVMKSFGSVLESNIHLEAKTTNMDIGDLVVTGIAELEASLYVIFQEKSFIRVFKADAPFEKESDKQLEELRDPFFIDACVTNNCLYITDKERKKVLKMGKDYTLNDWEMELEQPYRLSVISNGCVLIPKWSSPSSLEIYDMNGKNLKIISLPSDVIEPLHAVEMSEGVFAVSHGDKTSPLHRVCMIKCKPNSSMSELTLTFGHERGGYKKDQLNRPRNLAIDEHGRVIIADSGNMRVVVLDPGWKTFASAKVSIMPERLCYGRKSKQIFVGYFGTITTVAATHISTQSTAAIDIYEA